MPCEYCSGDKRSNYPFQLDRQLCSESHFGVSVGRCSYCGGPAILYWVEVFENLHDSATYLTPTELSAITMLTKESELQRTTMQILSSRRICIGGVEGFSWLPGNLATLDGPPW